MYLACLLGTPSCWIFYRGVRDFATGCFCIVRCHEFPTCLLYINLHFANLGLNNSWSVHLTAQRVFFIDSASVHTYIVISNDIWVSHVPNFDAPYCVLFVPTTLVFSFSTDVILNLSTWNLKVHRCSHEKLKIARNKSGFRAGCHELIWSA